MTLLGAKQAASVIAEGESSGGSFRAPAGFAAPGLRGPIRIA
jgi:hypothetical protein